MNPIYSFWRFITIQIQRFTDQTWRHLTGFPQRKRSMVTPELYVGGQYNIKSVPLLKQLGITGIVNMRMKKMTDKEHLKEFHILQLPTPDRQAPTMEHLEEGVAFIDKEIKQKGKVYIHCRSGEGRGPTMAIAYLIHTGMTYDDAYALIQKVRTFIKPTPPQVARLKEFEEIQVQKK
jgi:protein-tyrosine phosphatase